MTDINYNIKIDNKDFTIFKLEQDDLSLSNSSAIKDIISKKIKSGIKDIGVDLSEIHAVNSSGLGILIGLLNKVKTENGHFKIINPKDRLIEIFKITKLNLVFEVYYT